MMILGIESSAKAASAALCRDGALVAQYFQNSSLTHSRTLLPMIEDLLKNLEISLDDIGLIAVSRGPGSFTGIRIGVSIAKGLSWASETPVCGVSTLEAMAYNGVSAPPGSLICCCMDARRGQFYNALFEMHEGKPRRLCADRAISVDELVLEIKNFRKSVFLVGDGSLLCYNALDNFENSAALAPEPLRYQTAWGVCMAASYETPRPADELLPVYLRLSQAERERQERVFGNTQAVKE